ncbi:hypothetical protein GAY80_02195 [Phocaeicola vulgatus]|uniref:Uncharacterized protein n=2 Tax=Phocaeicola vulgatus TaxID=821 RepID=A0A7J5RMT5_PHOVU|nr:hypothetical protein GAY80_02195 [Phocaeicola vulgatus]KAB6563978.1 hypothetical protein GAY79_02200 [Phocaeicola vulgatus]KAB6567974.1 hypothetical protein GAY82_04175 [Phocaeicola vulgatus]KAB6570155.1 hypothetical protein GAY81_08940 [Phocaeicola vulgatus]KAB6582004.1 hypothetical protein GAY84_00975 [Phocaeicola vulgatus]
MSLSFVLMLKGAFTGYQMIFLFFRCPLLPEAGRMIVATRLNKDTRRDFIDFFLSEADPTYWREILKLTI